MWCPTSIESPHPNALDLTPNHCSVAGMRLDYHRRRNVPVDPNSTCYVRGMTIPQSERLPTLAKMSPPGFEAATNSGRGLKGRDSLRDTSGVGAIVR